MPAPRPGEVLIRVTAAGVNFADISQARGTFGGINAGQMVVIRAAAGGTGQAAVKMAKHYGATVIATASPGKHETVRALAPTTSWTPAAPISPPRYCS